MAVRIKDPRLDSTKHLLAQILPIILVDDSRVCFLVPAGQSEAVIQRLRVMISRKRKEIQQGNKRVRRFRLRDSVHQETHDGIRYDACILWKDTSETHEMLQDLEGMLTHG